MQYGEQPMKCKRCANTKTTVKNKRNAKNLQSVWFEFKLKRKKPHPKLCNESVHRVVFIVDSFFAFESFFVLQMARYIYAQTHTYKNREIVNAIILFFECVELKIKSNKEVVFLLFSIFTKFFVSVFFFYIYCWWDENSIEWCKGHKYTKSVKYQTNGLKFVYESD